MGWNVTCEMQESNQTASSSLTYGSTKYSLTVRSQPWWLNAEKKVSATGFTGAEHRGQSSSLPLCEPQGCPKAGMCYPRVRPHSRSGLTAARCSCSGLMQGEGTHATGEGCSQQHLRGAFYTNLFLYTMVKKKKKKKPLLVVHTEVWDSIGFRWVIDFKSQQHMLFPLPSHSLSSQPPWSKETNKWHTRLVVMWTNWKKKKGRRIEDEEKGKNKRRLKIKIRQDNAFYKHRDRNSYSKDRAGRGGE